MTDVTSTIQAAKAAAAALAAQQGAANTQIEAYVAPSGVATAMAKPSMSMAMASTSVIPRTAPFLKVNEYGIFIGKTDKLPKTALKGKILLAEDKGFRLKWTLRFGNPAQYYSTYDGVTCDKGGSWADAQMKVAAISGGAVEPYITADIVVALTEEVAITGGKLEVGTKVAINLSKTNFSEWQEFYTLAAEAGLEGHELEVDLGHREISYNGNTWGVVTFALPA